jgi:predicted lipoprotein with Yx(FWY)xxD motif
MNISDRANKSTCSARCAGHWPPGALAPGQESPIGRGLGHLGTILRSGGAGQRTYEGIPLYRFAGDTKAGQVKP